MRALIQRVSQAWVMVDQEQIAHTDQGLLVFLAIMRGDGQAQLEKMVHKVAGLRIFPDPQGRMNLSVLDIQGSVLVVSQFTLAAEMKKGFRPSFGQAEEPEAARIMVEAFCHGLRMKNIPVESGRFGADMNVHLVNDGPVTLWLDVPLD